MSNVKEEETREDRLQDALKQFESNVDAPIIPGEAVKWLELVATSFDEMTRMVIEQADQGHAAAFEQITEEDPEMFRRVEQMRSEDGEIREECDDIRHRLELLQPVTRRVDEDEKRVEDALSRFVPLAQALVARIRQQEVAVRTWLMEAFNRDRGIAD